ncbi:crotonase/enoyl-CoA hydratase family protein [Tropicimonas marinistellae]|uniref:crotonase/enoyl-CoA hydratase family protein n=1 Tax=Tropicimonas marinistellae TaxID=1739787 RepID=UPI000832A942|nr:crotonase/enoyl-CoA hydratase family protein [Tropicimonas marinistellae]
MSEELVRVENPQGPIAEVWFDRPKKKNALTLDMLDRLTDVGRALAKEAHLRAVILAGTGGDFSAGLDTDLLVGMEGQADTLKTELLNPPDGGAANRFQLPATIWSQVSVPVIAAVEGVCFGAGLQIALGADLRIARPDARLSIMEGKWGLIPDMGISETLPHLLSADRAKELIMTARILQGAEAHALGLVTRLSDAPLEEARNLARALCSRSPDAVRAGKRLVDRIYENALVQGLRLEAELQAALIGSPNQVETVAAALQNRPPSYR